MLNSYGIIVTVKKKSLHRRKALISNGVRSIENRNIQKDSHSPVTISSHHILSIIIVSMADEATLNGLNNIQRLPRINVITVQSPVAD
jgi:hypothetical protein